MQERANTILDTITQDLKAGIREIGGHLVDALVDTTRFVVEGLNKAGEFVSDMQGNAGYILDGIYYEDGEAVDGVVSVRDGIVKVGEEIVGSLINASRFFSDGEYRQNEGIPWLMKVIENNQKLIAHQMEKNSDALEVLYRYSLGQELDQAAVDKATEQLLELAKLIPALAIFLLPGGGVLLPTLAKLLPWDLLPNLSQMESALEESGKNIESSQ